MIGSGPPRVLPLGLSAAVLLAIAIVLGWRAGATPPPPAPVVAATPWSLPKPIRVDPTKDIALLRSRHPWTGLFTLKPATATPVAGRGLPAAPGPKSPVAPAWRLAGIVARGDARFAMIAEGGGTTAAVQYLKIGDRLPDGGTLVALSADSATVEAGKVAARRVYRLFAKKP